MPALIAALIYVLFGALAFRAYMRARRYRLETPDRIVKYRGTPWQWLRSVLAPSNYVTEGQRPLRWFWFWLALFQLGLFGIVAILAAYYP